MKNTPAAAPVAEKSTPPSTGDCPIKQARDFDFWIGRWEVRTPDGKLAGYNHIRPILDGCSLQEDYHTAKGKYKGRSLNRYDPASQQWHQVWIDNGGLWLSIAGGLEDGAMVMRGDYLQRRDPKGKLLESPKATIQEIRWSLLPDKRVRQTWRSSSDGGKTWQLLFDGYYKKMPNTASELG